jgi:hypothetical protein
MKLAIPPVIRGQRGRWDVRVKPYRYRKPTRIRARDGKPLFQYGHTWLGAHELFYNPNKQPITQARTVIHEQLHAMTPWWWRYYRDIEGPPEAMIRRLEAVVWDLVRAFVLEDRKQRLEG